MAKVRVSELAKEYGITSKQALELLTDMGEFVKSASSGVEPPVVKRALRGLDYMQAPLAPSILRSRTIYQTALETGRSAEEGGDPTAAREVAALWEHVAELLAKEKDEAAA